MKLKFFARDDLLVTVPGVRLSPGQALPRVGRDHVRGYVDPNGDKSKDRAGSTPATAEGSEFDSDSEAGRRLIKLVQREASLWPANKETADACGVPFVEVEFKDGAFAPKKPKKSSDKGAE